MAGEATDLVAWPVPRAQAWQGLAVTTAALVLSFAVWSMWSALVLDLPALGFDVTDGGRWTLAALPALTGALLRVPFAHGAARLGPRASVALGTLALVVPCLAAALVLRRPATPFPVLAAVAACAGLGGANLAAFAQCKGYFPHRRQGLALGLLAGLGNLGVGLVQLVAPVVVEAPLFGAMAGPPLAVTGPVWLPNLPLAFVAPAVALGALAAMVLDPIPLPRPSFGAELAVLGEAGARPLVALHAVSLGTFLGLAASAALLVDVADAGAPIAVASASALLGALARPIGGFAGDALGGTVVLVAFAGMLVGAAGIALGGPLVPLVVAMSVGAGLGNGATWQAGAAQFAGWRAGPVLGYGAAIGGVAAFVVPGLLRASFVHTGSFAVGFAALAAVYVAGLWLAVRGRGVAPRVPSS